VDRLYITSYFTLLLPMILSSAEYGLPPRQA